MTTTLMLLAGERWPHDPVADWVLLDGGRPLDSGRSEPRHWPTAQRHELVLAGSRALWLELVLPPAPRREQPQLIRYALESQLARDPDLQHATVSAHGGASARYGVIVIERRELITLIAACNALGRPLAAVRTALQLAPPQPGSWTLAMLPGDSAVLRPDARSGIALDAAPSAALFDWLTLQWAATPPQERPQTLEVRCASGVQRPPVAVLTALDGVESRDGDVLEWWKLPPDAVNLLHGEFAPTHDRNALWQRLKAPLALAAGAAALWLLVQVAAMIIDGHEARTLHESGVRIAAEALPGQALLDPRLQLRRALDRSLQAHGQLAAGDLLSLFNAALEAGADRPVGLHYEDGQLTLQLADAPAAELLARLDARGLAARSEGTSLILTTRP